MHARKIVGVILAMLMVAVFAGFWFLYSPPPKHPRLSARVERESILLGNRARSFLAYVPAKLKPGAPLVIVLHGWLQDGAGIRVATGYEFDAWADRLGFAVVYPDGFHRAWNDCRRDVAIPAKYGIDDLAFIRRLIAQMQAEHGIDAKRVYAFGLSRGAHMAMRLAIEAPEDVAAVAAVAANLPVPGQSLCPATGRTARVMLVDGTADPINPYDGGVLRLFGLNRGLMISAEQTARDFARRNGIAAEPTVSQLPHLHTDDPTRVTRETWSANGALIVVLYTVHGGGHTVPQDAFRFPRILGRTNRDLDTPKAALEFFGLLPGE